MKCLCLILLLSCCGREIARENAHEDEPIEVNMNLEGMARPKIMRCKSKHGGDEAQYTMVVYVDKDACPTCFVSDLAEWNILMQTCKREKLPLRFVFIFGIPSTRKSVFMATLSSSSISDISYVDVKGVFVKRNPWITKDRERHVFLISQGRKPVFLPTPFDVERIKMEIHAK